MPAQADNQMGSFELVPEIIKNVFNLADVFAIYYALNYIKSGSGESLSSRMLALTLGSIFLP